MNLLDIAEAEAQRDTALQRVAQRAEDHRPGFLEDACAFVVRYLEQHGPTPGEALTVLCKQSGIVPPDDRAFGPVLMSLSRRGLITKVGTCVRARGHRTAGGNIWGLVAAKESR